MTTQQSFKRRIRERMAKTGESYTAARAQLLPADVPGYEPQTSTDAVVRNTGRTYPEWFALLDAWGAAEREHGEIAAWIGAEHGVPGWWCQNVTVEYERARGLRPLRGDRDGTRNVSASRTIAAPAERVFEAFVDRWPELRLRTGRPPRSARFDWEDGATRVNVLFTAKDAGRTTVAVSHERLPDEPAAEAMKALWRERLAELKAQLETFE
jgi:hypothetical protein